MSRSLVAVLLALCVATILHAQGGIASAPAKFLVAPTQVVATRQAGFANAAREPRLDHHPIARQHAASAR